MTKKKQTAPQHKERGGCLTAFVILIAIHGILASFLIWYLRAQDTTTRFPWALPVLFILSLADIVAAIAIWYWKKWGLILYAVATFAGIAAGLVLTRSQLVVFHDIVPLVILGYVVRDKLKLFD
jgi:hypothetical protein